MRTITHQEIRASADRIHEMSRSETREFMRKMSEEQPFITAYVAAICQRGDFRDENDADAFANMATISWHAIREAAPGPLAQVQGSEIDECEARIMQLYEYAEGEPESAWPRMLAAWMEGYSQRPLLEFVLDMLMSPENPYAVTPDAIGLIFTYLKVIIDCLNEARVMQRV